MDDLAIIVGLQDEGPGFLELVEEKEKLIAYEKLYLKNELEENSFEKYVEYIINNDIINLWKYTVNEFSENEFMQIIKKSITYITKKQNDTSILLSFLTKVLFVSDNTKQFFENDTTLFEIIFRPLLTNLKMDNNWEINIKAVQVFTKKIITNKDNKNARYNFIKFISEFLNICIQKINMNVDDIDLTLPNDYEITNYLGLLLTFWNEGMTIDKIDTVDYDYIISDSCTIKWLDSKIINDTKQYSFLTQCFFLILHAIRVGYVPTMYRSKKWTEYLEKINAEIEALTTDSVFMSGFLTKVLTQQKKMLESYLVIDNDIMNNKLLITWINNFYTIGITWILRQKNKAIDDFIPDLLYFITHFDDYDVNNDNMNNLLIDTINGKYLNNINLRCDAIIPFKRMIESPLLNEYNRRKYLTPLAIGFISLHNSIHKENIHPIYKLRKKVEIYNLINILYLHSKHNNNDIMEKELLSNLDIFKKFMNIILMDLCDFNDQIEKFNIDSDSEQDHINIAVAIYTHYVKMLIFINSFFDLIFKNKDLHNIILSKEILLTLITIINLSIKILSTKLCYSDELYVGSDNDPIDIGAYVVALTNIIKLLYINGCDMKLFTDDHAFDIELYKEFSTYTDNEFEGIVTILNNIMKNTSDSDELENVPDEFIDPITYVPIEEPCLLPGMVGFSDGNIFFNKTTILKQLITKEENPYTRQKLTLDEFEDFNKQEIIRNKNDEFKIKFDTWKKQQNHGKL
ncbi:ubiquitin fusion degradation protein 2 [Klosneuvirus KNV1]|uniref:Ubiquitin fusion degradation protein 2 n=1 Tax=Klosneuvirus KNV1 TaxID=1977640 RepID=A0A1V0SHW0_9VIRU|nr:ubiquitin fusion degradation protein 2 [Klosneuvirus KNV1]